MEIETRQVGDVTILDCAGNISLGEGTMAIRNTVRELLKDGDKKILVNLANVNYIDSSGIGELVSTYTNIVKEGGDIRLLNPIPKIRELLNITKLATRFEIFEDEQTALDSFAASNTPASGSEDSLLYKSIAEFTGGSCSSILNNTPITGGQITWVDRLGDGGVCVHVMHRGQPCQPIFVRSGKCTAFRIEGVLLLVDKESKCTMTFVPRKA
jgi:anti-sigma B factor antagonist